MPLDLNQYNLEKLTEEIKKLRPSQALVSNDGIIVRRRHNSSGYDCGVGQGGHSSRKMNSASDAAEVMLALSANYTHPEALGGEEKYDDIETAIESVRRGDSRQSGPSPALKSIRAFSRNATLASYRNRAQQARKLLSQGKVWEAVRQIEAVIQHAGQKGSLEDVERAETALQAIRENHEYEPGVPTLSRTKLEIRTRGTEHFVYQDGKPATQGMTRSDAEARKSFMAREAAREEELANIESEIAGKPIVVERAEEAA